jgi:hypothetical protein
LSLSMIGLAPPAGTRMPCQENTPPKLGISSLTAGRSGSSA